MQISKVVNFPITIVGLLLISIGILVIYSSSKELAFQQSIFAVFGIIIFFLVSRIELHSIKKLITPLYFFILTMLLAVLILGFETRGALRWIPLGLFNVQPSEFAKPVLILYLAKFWSERLPSWRNILKSLFWSTPLILLIFKQPDLGSALTIVAIWVGILFASSVSIKKLVVLFLTAVCVVPLGWLFLHDYQKQRILSFLAPENDPLGRGYNLIQAVVAVGSGEFLGRGLGRGTQSRLQFLPEFRTDFIFASIAEELGFVGSILVLSIYLFLFVYCLRIAQKANNSLGFLVVIGVVSMLLFQTVVNIGMNIGILPITGITLPLISYGGSSLIATLICLGMVASVSGFRGKIDPDELT